MTTSRFPAKHQMAAARVPLSVFRRFLVRVTPAADGKDAVTGAMDSSDERPAQAGGEAAEVGSVALDRMVLSFMEDQQRPPRGRCNCFNGGGPHGGSDDEDDLDFLPSPSAHVAAKPAAGDASELIKGLVQCASAAERGLLADASRIAEHQGRRVKKAELRRAVAAGLRALGYDAAVCRSRWDRAPSRPAGEHEYIDALLPPGSDGPRTRVVVEVDFRAEFEVARPTKPYRAALQALPPLFVGAPDRMGKVVAVVAEAARQSMRKRGLHFPPWRKPEYVRAKWLAPHSRLRDHHQPPELALRFDDKAVRAAEREGEDKKGTDEASEQLSLPDPKPARGKVVVAGLASVLS